jgi:hypothetical protein
MQIENTAPAPEMEAPESTPEQANDIGTKEALEQFAEIITDIISDPLDL